MSRAFKILAALLAILVATMVFPMSTGCSSRARVQEPAKMPEPPPQCSLCGVLIPERSWEAGDYTEDGCGNSYHFECSMPEDPGECDETGGF